MPQTAQSDTDAGRAGCEELLRLLGHAGPVPDWSETWDQSVDSLPAAGPAFLERSFVEESAAFLDLGSEARQSLRDGLALFADVPALRRLAWHCHWLLFCQEPRRSCQFHTWPRVPGAVHPSGPMFYAYVMLSGVPAVRDEHRRRGVPEAVTRATLADLGLWMADYRRTRGAWGFDNLSWLHVHFASRLFALGRLQFMLDRYTAGFRAFRSRRTGQVLFLAGDGMRIRPDGQLDGTDDVFDPASRVARLAENGRQIRGTPVRASGSAESGERTLDAAEWAPVLGPGDPVLSIHIPASGPLDFAACGRSVAEAVPFFARHFPEHAYRAFTCGSWLMDPQFEGRLPDASNIVRFLREFYLLPMGGSMQGETFRRVFGRADIPLAEAPRATALQRAVAAHVESGGRWRCGIGVLFREELPWGRQAYRGAGQGGA